MEDKFYMLGSFEFAADVQIIKGKLESEGIPVFLRDENTLNSDPLISNAIGGVKLQVYTKDKERAIKVYNEIVGNLYESFNEVTENLEGIFEGKNSTVAVSDLDNDGLLEFVVGNIRGGISIYDSNLGLDGLVNVSVYEDPKLSVFPNPFDNQLVIDNKSIPLKSIKIYNSNGQLVYDTENIMNPNQITTSGWSTGIYFIEFVDENNRISSKKLIKQ